MVLNILGQCEQDTIAKLLKNEIITLEIAYQRVIILKVT